MATSAAPPPPPPLPTTTKKPRRKAREVSSRYLSTPAPSPLPSSASSSPLHSSSSLSNHHHHSKHRRSPSIPSSPDSTDTESEPSSRFSDENQPINRSLDTPIFLNSVQNKGFGTQRRRAVKLFGDNGNVTGPPRTPMAAATPKGANLSGTQLRTGRNTSARGERSNLARPDESYSENSEVDNCSVSSHGGFCHSPPITGSRVRQAVTELRSSMPESDILSSRRDGNESSCCRSLNLALSSSQQNPFHQRKQTGRNIPSKLCLPPQPPSSKLEGEIKKGKKQEDVHMIRILHSKYLQWRFVNAKAKESAVARTNAAERSLYGLSMKISEMRESVIEKKIEVERLKRLKSLSAVLELQMPYLDNWSSVEEDYSSSLTGVTKALQDASLRLPITGNVKADIKDLKEVFDSIMNIFNCLSPCVQRFVPKGEVVEDVISNLAELVSTERALIEECGSLLSQAHNLQVTECSLRGQLIQAKRSAGV